MFGLYLLIKSLYDLISSFASNRPIILSASRTADISGVVTTIASVAPATAFWKPCSIPAGQSTKTKSNFSFNSSQIFFNCSSVTAVLSLVCAAASKHKLGFFLSFTRACFSLHLSSTTSTIV